MLCFFLAYGLSCITKYNIVTLLNSWDMDISFQFAQKVPFVPTFYVLFLKS
jgi:hypothetical protein